MAEKAYIEDFKLLDEKTMKEVDIHRAMPLFQFIEYKRGEAFIGYKLNDSLTEYLLDLKRDFTQLKFSDTLLEILESYNGKAYFIKDFGELVCGNRRWDDKCKISLPHPLLAIEGRCCFSQILDKKFYNGALYFVKTTTQRTSKCNF